MSDDDHEFEDQVVENDDDHELGDQVDKTDDVSVHAEVVPPPIDTWDGDLDGYCSFQPTNDMGNAQRLIHRHGEDLLFVQGSGWLAWDGARWSRRGGAHMAAAYSQSTARKIVDEARSVAAGGDKKRAGPLFSHAVRSGNQNRLTASLAAAATMLRTLEDEFDTHPFLVTTKSGAIELGERVNLRPAHRDDRMTRIIDTTFDESAPALEFEKFVEKILPDPEVREFVRRFFGYCLSGDTSEQVVALFYGLGNNGKSTLINCVSHVLGDFHQTLPFSSFVRSDRRGGGDATPDLAKLPGARLVTASEPEVGDRLSESLIKWMTGGERMTVRKLHEDYFDFTPQFKVILAFNSRPVIRGTDDGIWRRLLLVPFDRKIGKDDVAPVYAALEDEAPGILQWLCNGFELWRESGLAVPERVRAATESYRTDFDQVGRFIAEWCETGKVEILEERTGVLWNAYTLWCRQAGEEPSKQKRFGDALRDRGYPASKSVGNRTRKGIKVSAAALAILEEDAQRRDRSERGEID